jgi:hypothetical protein
MNVWDKRTVKTVKLGGTAGNTLVLCEDRSFLYPEKKPAMPEKSLA